MLNEPETENEMKAESRKSRAVIAPCARFSIRFLLLSAFCGLPGLSSAGGPGSTAVPVLQIPLGARALALGGAYTAVADDVYALNYNPAGLGNLHYQEATGMFVKGLDDTTLGFAGYAQPFSSLSLSGAGPSVFGAGVLVSQNGTIEFNQTNPDGSFLGAQDLRAGADTVVTLGYGERMGETGMDLGYGPFMIRHYLGAAAKYVHSQLAQAYQASTYGLDLGYLGIIPQYHVSMGISVQNLGGRLRFIDEGDPLPVTLRTGVSYRLPTLWSQTFLFTANNDYFYYEQNWVAGVGIEYSYDPLLSVRAGYRFHQDQDGATFGFGIHQAGLYLDYAFGMESSLGNVQRVTLSYRFGGVAPREAVPGRVPAEEEFPSRSRIKELEGQTPAYVPQDKKNKREQGVSGWIY